MKATDRAKAGVCSGARRLAVALGGLCLCATVSLAQVPPPAPLGELPSPSKVVVYDVVPQGLHNVSPERVKTMLKTRVGADYNRAVAEEDVRRLYDTHQFADVRVVEEFTPQGVTVHFQFRELPNIIQEIIYRGAKHASPDELNGVTGLRKGIPLNPVINQQACVKIVQFYNEKGRGLASCDLVEGGQPGDTRVVFSITEGKVLRVSDISIIGCDFVSASRLKTQVTTSTKFLGMNLGGKYNPTLVDMDVAKLEEYYRGFGYHDVKVSREVVWEDSDDVRIIFHIREGRRYVVGHIGVEGPSTASHDELMSLVEVKSGEPINEQKIKTDVSRIQAWYGYRGDDARVDYIPVWEEKKPGVADVVYHVEESPPATVGQIIIVGNEVTRQNVILRQVPLFPGQVLTFPDLRVAESNLQRLNIFENDPEKGVRPTVSVIDNDPSNPVKDVLVTVQETATGSLLFGVGVNSDAGLTGSIVLNERNFDIARPPTSIDDLLSGHAFRGAGQEFRIEAVPGTQLQRYTVSFREPYLFDSKYSLGVSAYYYDRVFNEDTESRIGTRITLGRRLNPFWTASAALRVEGVDIRNVGFGAPPDYTSVEGENFLLGGRVSLTRDTRDSFLRATKGSLLDLSYEQVTGAFTFPIFNIEANKYLTVYQRPDESGRHVLAYHGQVSWEGSNAPVYERFFAGGFRSMRGFEFRGVSPDINGFKVGGDFMFLNSLEYQIPIRANDQIYLVGFVDSGTVSNNFDLSDYRVSAGVGIRIVVPMLGPVPIALDFGFPIVKDPADRTQIFQFWVGFFH